MEENGRLVLTLLYLADPRCQRDLLESFFRALGWFRAPVVRDPGARRK